jgi:Leucine-rich repeat (LRR) protein
MSNITIYPYAGLESVLAINCGTALLTPKLSGSIDVSMFPNLRSFTCTGNDIVSFTGTQNNPSITAINIQSNKISSPLPSLLGNPTLQTFNCSTNLLSGRFPDLSNNTQLQTFVCNNNTLSAFNRQALSFAANTRLITINTAVNPLSCGFPDISQNTLLAVLTMNNCALTGAGPTDFTNNTNLVTFNIGNNNITSIPSFDPLTKIASIYVYGNTTLTGTFPSLTYNTQLQNFYCYQCNFTGSFPSLATNTKLIGVGAFNNNFTGTIPDLTNLTQLNIFNAFNNQFTDYAGGPNSFAITLSSIQLQNNALIQTAIDNLLKAAYNTNRSGSANIFNSAGGTNSAPTYTGGVTKTTSATNFVQSGTTVTVTLAGHGLTTGDMISVDGVSGGTGTSTNMNGTFIVTSTSGTGFTYTCVKSGTSRGGSVTASIRKTTVATDGFRYYQLLELPTTQTFGGNPGRGWTMFINNP